jgi:hypothetical protein
MDKTNTKFKAIVAHYGPLHSNHSLHLGSMFNLLMECNDGRFTTAPMDSVLQSDLQIVVQYTVDRKLVNLSEWTSQLPERIRNQLPRVLQPVAASYNSPIETSCADDIKHCKFVSQALKKSFGDIESYTDDESCRILRDGVFEIFLGTCPVPQRMMCLGYQ